MNDRRQGLLIAFVLVVLGLGATFLLFEEVETVEEHLPSREARLNDHLALLRLMEERGYNVRSVPALTSQMLATTEAIVWVTEEHLDLRQRNAAVGDWLAEGGKLIVGDSVPGPVDPFLNALIARRGDTQEALSATPLVGPYAHDDDSEYLDLAATPVGEGGVRFGCRVGDALAAVGPYEDGTIGVIAAMYRFTNDRLLDTEAGPLFWDVVRLMELPKDILFVYSESSPSLSELLWKHARPLVISSVVLLLVWLLHVSRRFGPLVPPRERAQRSLLEHVAATGSLLWRQGARDVLIDSVRDAVRHRIMVSRADWAHLEEQELAARLAEVASLPQADVLAALTEPASTNPSHFSRQITHLQQLRAALGGST
ncbi:MAG: hypothetical protein KDA24_01090 [Deltaproteobacteria bacterium]|nr:hypothetical protein [Deltaproteobacteria bacterium]